MDFIKTLPLLAAIMAPSMLSAADYLDRSAWSWKTSSECSAEDDITGLAGIADGNTYTCWHSNYHAASGSAERKNPHWVMIDRGSDSKPAYGLAYLPRQNGGSANTSCTRYAIYFGDKSLENTPSSSELDIIYALGDPAYTGTWDGNLEEKFVNFSSPVTSRYILFVNLESNGSNSAACSEMNLLASKAQGGGGTNPSGNFNAIRIVTPEGDEHRIAIDGSQLAFSMAGGNIRMGNSGITVEYAMSEVKHFKPEHYDFPEEELYVGPKKDIYAFPPELTLDREVLTLEEGKTATLTATLANVTPGAEVSWTSSNEAVASVDETGLVSAIKAGMTEVSASYGDVIASCMVTVTEAAVGIIDAPVSTVTFRRDGENLYIGGLTPGNEVVLHSLAGIKVASAKVSSLGQAVISVGSLPSGAYLLSASGLTLKISF